MHFMKTENKHIYVYKDTNLQNLILQTQLKLISKEYDRKLRVPAC